MRAYGVKRTWNAVEDGARGGRAYRAGTFAKVRRVLRRRARRTGKAAARALKGEVTA